MSRQHVSHYRRTLAEQHRVTGSLNERVLRKAFADLLERTGRAHDLVFTNEWEGKGPRGNNIAVDGALVPAILRKPFGYWEAKDSKDDLDREIADKLASGYPDDNIIYEDTRTAILRQDGREAIRIDLTDDDALLNLLQRFYGYERPELTEFKAASAKFRADLPQVLDALRMAIGEAEARSSAFATALSEFLGHARQAINPAVSAEDVREMLIQHILTEEIFASVFDNAQYHRENNVARRLGELEAKFFTGELRWATTELLRPYYGAIKHAASDLADRRAKQDFLKRLYEDFYKVYNPAAADRLGVVYTPGEIVRFMIRGAEWLTEKHFGKTLADEGVEILDPATGTGTFVVELLEHMQGAGRERLRAKYLHELHANEVAILPYYVANLNIEATFASISGQYAEFPGLVFVDTLDNIGALSGIKGRTHYGDLLGSIADENLARVRRQNTRQISIIIGNPPYNANQTSENDNNKNRKYEFIDARINETYVKHSTARKLKLEDPYIRFLRWATERLGKDGIIAFVSNSSFLKKHSFDGVRKIIEREFDEVWVVDLKGDARTSGETRKREGGNVFHDNVKVGVAIYFLVRRAGKEEQFTIHLDTVDDFVTSGDKLAGLTTELSERRLEVFRPSEPGDWRPVKNESLSDRLPLACRATRADPSGTRSPAIFMGHAIGVSTNRDDWVYAKSEASLVQKMKRFITVYDTVSRNATTFPPEIKWSRNLKRAKKSNRLEDFDRKKIVLSYYRPFTRRYFYRSDLFIDELGRAGKLFPEHAENVAICFNDIGSRTSFLALAVTGIADLHFGAAVDGYQQVARYRYTKSGERVDNVTDWAVRQFRARYGSPLPTGEGGARSAQPSGSVRATELAGHRPHPAQALPESPSPEGRGREKDAIFAYCYAVLHDPVYRATHADDLRREFPRIPLYDDFALWAGWGERLLTLHIDYEKAKPFAFGRVDAAQKKERDPGSRAGVTKEDTHSRHPGLDPGSRFSAPRPKLKSFPEQGIVIVDEDTQLTGIPPEAWSYRLGNRSAIDWVLDQHKEKTPRDPTVAARFNTYRFADHKESMIALLAKVVTVSVETVKITEAMKAQDRQGRDEAA